MIRCAALLLVSCLASLTYAQAIDEEHAEIIDLSDSDLPVVDENLDLHVTAALITKRTNELRLDAERSPVTLNPQLVAAARYFAHYMAEHDRYGHTADQRRPAQRAYQHQYEYCIVSENIAYQYSSRGFTAEDLARKFTDGWQRSPPHYKNMIDPDVMETGMGIARSKQTGYYYAVQMFGRPKSASIQFRVVNRSGATIKYEVGGKRLPLPPRYTRVHEECRPGKVVFLLNDDDDEQPDQTRVVEPQGGEEFIVIRLDEHLEVRMRGQ